MLQLHAFTIFRTISTIYSFDSLTEINTFFDGAWKSRNNTMSVQTLTSLE